MSYLRAKRLMINGVLGAAGMLYIFFVAHAELTPNILVLAAMGAWGLVFHYASCACVGSRQWCFIFFMIAALLGACAAQILLYLCTVASAMPVDSVAERSILLVSASGWVLGGLLWMRANGITWSWLVDPL